MARLKLSTQPDHRKMADLCAKAANKTYSMGDRKQLKQMQQEYLELAERDETRPETS